MKILTHYRPDLRSHRAGRALRSLVVPCALCAFSSLAQAQAATNPSPSNPAAEKKRVEAVVQKYLHGLEFNDTLALREAFTPDAKLMFVKRDGTAGQLTQSEWYKLL